MNKTIVLCSYNRPIQDGTRRVFEALQKHGAAIMMHAGVTDVTLARNLALSAACDFARTLKASPDEIVVLMVDDDMVFDVPAAQELVDHARRTGVAASGMYATTMGALAASRLRTAEGESSRWATGLGMLAVPLPLLLELEQRSEPFLFLDRPQHGFTWSGARDGNYWSEDYTLTRRLGGVHLLPIPIGHMKTIPLWPDEETVACIREGRRLPGDLESAQLRHVTDPEMIEAMTFGQNEPSAAPEVSDGAA